MCAACDWDEITRKSGVDRNQIDEIAAAYAAAKNVVFSWTMGITHHAHGVENVQADRQSGPDARHGRPAAAPGLLPIRGHSNVQGIGSVGVTPKLKQAIFESLESELSVSACRPHRGLDTLGCMEAAHDGQLKIGFCLGGNLYGSNPDSRFAAESLSRLQIARLPQHDAQHGPRLRAWRRRRSFCRCSPATRSREPTTQESMFNFVRLSDGGPAPPRTAERSRSDRAAGPSGAGHGRPD